MKYTLTLYLPVFLFAEAGQIPNVGTPSCNDRPLKRPQQDESTALWLNEYYMQHLHVDHGKLEPCVLERLRILNLKSIN